jgi:hypothetical protein
MHLIMPVRTRANRIVGFVGQLIPRDAQHTASRSLLAHSAELKGAWQTVDPSSLALESKTVSFGRMSVRSSDDVHIKRRRDNGPMSAIGNRVENTHAIDSCFCNRLISCALWCCMIRRSILGIRCRGGLWSVCNSAEA